jgi:plastocyanin
MVSVRMRPVLLVATVAAGMFVGFACGGSDAPGTAGSVTAQAVPAGAPEVNQADLAFKPEKLTVAAGTTVYFKNSDSAIHTVNVNGKNESGTMKKGAIFAWTPATAGTYKLTCDYHPQMNASIFVQ